MTEWAVTDQTSRYLLDRFTGDLLLLPAEARAAGGNRLAKQRRGQAPRTTKTIKKKATARKGSAPKTTRRVAAKGKARSVSRPPVRPKTRVVAPKAEPAVNPAPASAPPAPAPPRKPGFYEAVAIYERGVQALQRHDFGGAAELFRVVIERYPEERELLERARLYLRVCERETARLTPPPESAKDHVYAATVALNSGDHAGALAHSQRALTMDDSNDHAHYIMAAALSLRGRRDEALMHLKRSISLNPENRTQAREDPDLENIRGHQDFRAVVEDTPVLRRKAAPLRRR